MIRRLAASLALSNPAPIFTSTLLPGTTTLLLMGIVVGTATLTARPAPAAIDDCLTIENMFSRLRCYDEEAGFDPAAVKEDEVTIEGEQSVRRGDWRVQVETSRIDDSTNVYLELTSDEHTNCPYERTPHHLAIACRENQTNLWVYFGGCFMSDHNGKGRVTYRLDSEDARTEAFVNSNDHSALGL